jgi:hypothetical protein
LREVFRDRRLSLSSMDPSLRTATAGAAACVLATVLFTALRDVGGTPVYLGRNSSVVTSIAAPMFTASLVLVSLGFGYLLTAATLASRRVAIPVLLLSVVGVGSYTGAFGGLVGGLDLLELLPAWARWTCRGLLAAMLGLGAAVMARDHRPGVASAPRRVRLTVLAAFALLFGGYLFALKAGLPTIGGLNDFGPAISLLFGQLVFVMYPILQVAGVDFGEWGQLSAQRIGTAVEGPGRSRLPLIALAACLALAGFAYADLRPGTAILSGTRIVLGVKDLLLFGAVLVVVGVAGRLLKVRDRTWPATLGFGGLVAVCALTGVVVPPVTASLSGAFRTVTAQLVTPQGRFAPGADVVPLTLSTPRGPSVLVPRGWLAHPSATAAVATNYDGKGGSEQVTIAQLPPTSLAAVAQVFHVAPAATRHVGEWEMVDSTAPGYPHVEVWTRPAPASAGSGTDAIVERSDTAAFGDPTNLFHAVAASFRPPGRPPAAVAAGQTESPDQQRLDRERVIGLAGEILVLIVLLVLVVWRGRRWGPRSVAAVYLLGMLVVFEIVYFLDEIGRVVSGASAAWPYLSQYGLLFASGVVGAAAAIVVGVRREFSPQFVRTFSAGLLGLIGAAAVLDLMSTLYGDALSADRISIWAAIILLIATAWDVTMSGESMTNLDSRHLPRHTRVLSFLGYVIVLGGVVLFFTAQRSVASGHSVEPFFEPEAVTQAALFRVAFPLLLLMFLLRIAGARPTRPHDPGVVSDA